MSPVKAQEVPADHIFTVAHSELAKMALGFYIAVMEQSQLDQYVGVGILAIVAAIFAGGILVASVIFGKKGRRTPIKDSAYECGMLPIGSGIPRMSVKFYLVAMLFILFDIEVVFLYPWAVVYKRMLAENAALIFGSMFSFLGILFVGYVYALKKGAFDWRH